MKYGEQHWKKSKMRNTPSRTRIVARDLKNVENEAKNLYDPEYGEKHWKSWKMRNAHCRTWNMARNIEKHEIWKNIHHRAWIVARKLTNVENEKQTLYDLEKDKLTNEENEKVTWYNVKYGEKHWNTCKMRNTHCTSWIREKQWNTWNRKNTHFRTWIEARKLTNVETETQSLYDLENGE